MGRRKEFWTDKHGDRHKSQWAKDRDARKNREVKKKSGKFFTRGLIHGSAFVWAGTRIHPLEHLVDAAGIQDYEAGDQTILGALRSGDLGLIAPGGTEDRGMLLLGDILEGDFDTGKFVPNLIFTTLEGDIVDAAVVWGPSVIYEALCYGLAGRQGQEQVEMLEAFVGAIVPNEAQKPVKAAARGT